MYTFDVSGVTDYDGNAASGATTSSFTTGTSYDWSRPTVAGIYPADGSGINDQNYVSVTVSHSHLQRGDGSRPDWFKQRLSANS